MYASKNVTREERAGLRIAVMGGADDALQEVAVTCLRASDYRVFETPLDAEPSALMTYDLVVVVAAHEATGALARVEATRAADPTLPIIIVAQEAAYLDLWPRTAELEVTAFYSLSADLPRFLATVDDLILA